MWCWCPSGLETSYSGQTLPLYGIGTHNIFEELPFWSLPWTIGLCNPIKNIENNLTLTWTI